MAENQAGNATRARRLLDQTRQLEESNRRTNRELHEAANRQVPIMVPRVSAGRGWPDASSISCTFLLEDCKTGGPGVRGLENREGHVCLRTARGWHRIGSKEPPSASGRLRRAESMPIKRHWTPVVRTLICVTATPLGSARMIVVGLPGRPNLSSDRSSPSASLPRS